MPMQSIAAELTSLVETTVPTLKALSPADAARRPAPGKWSIQEILGHLVDSAANNHQRFVRAQDVDVLTFPKYEQNHWVDHQGYNHSPWRQLVAFWRLYNLHLAHVMRQIPADKLNVECRIEPYDPVTLQFLVEDYVVHQRHHLAKINELSGLSG